MPHVQRRLTAVLAGCGLAASALAGCGGSPAHERGAAASGAATSGKTVRAASSDTRRVTRVSRVWLSPGWTSGKPPQVSVRMELTVYQDGGAAQAVRELREVPTTCHTATDSSGASRTHSEEKYTVRGVRDSAGVIARLGYLNGATGFEATAALQEGEHLVGYLVVTTTSWTTLGPAMGRLLPSLKAALNHAGPVVDDDTVA